MACGEEWGHQPASGGISEEFCILRPLERLDVSRWSVRLTKMRALEEKHELDIFQGVDKQ
jgi:hypothetical protein